MNEVLFGDCIESLACLKEGGVKVQMCVTSPPYFNLRDYGVPGQIGLEKTLDEYIAKLVQVFRGVRDILADDGTLWLNMGDSYAGSWGNYSGGNRGKGKQREITTGSQAPQHAWDGMEKFIPAGAMGLDGIKPKDLMGVPWALAFALRADGWYLRQEIIWAKHPKCMPESVTDRCTKSHEHLFLLSKSPDYYFDYEAIKEPSVDPKATAARYKHKFGGDKSESIKESGKGRTRPTGEREFQGKRRKRDVWLINPVSYRGAHFAVFPEALVEPCILAGTSEAGHCPVCGKRHTRVTVRGEANEDWKKACGADSNGEYLGQAQKDYEGAHAQNAAAAKARILAGMVEIRTVGWEPQCKCGVPPVPDTVIDPFIGSGTTAAVAVRLGRRYWGCELNPGYKALQDERIEKAKELA